MNRPLILKQSILFCIPWALFFAPTFAKAQKISAQEIIAKVEQTTRGNSSKGELSMTVIRPNYTRSMTIKSWTMGNDKAILLVTAPARDKGTAFLRDGKEVWNWQPTIDRVVKMPPSMLSQSWMGSDFSNDDLVKQTSLLIDFNHRIIREEILDSRKVWVIEMLPKQESAVVWGKVVTWIDQEYYIQLKSEFYDEDNYLVSTIRAGNLKKISGRTLATRLEIIPEEEKGNKTIIEQNNIEFDSPLTQDFFTIRNMKRLQ
jgi:outer membrane lipoprotein-sorting protein